MKTWEYRKFSFEERVKMFTSINPLTGCHEFTGRKDSYGYAQIKLGKKQILVHRWIWMQKHGEISSTIHVLHKCDNPSCINPDHLFIGNHADNMADKAIKNRCNPPRGAKHKRPMAKLTEEQVKEIKKLLKRGYTQADIARDFKTSRGIISDISLGKTWCHVT